jgi:hypothetical protein
MMSHDSSFHGHQTPSFFPFPNPNDPPVPLFVCLYTYVVGDVVVGGFFLCW